LPVSAAPQPGRSQRLFKHRASPIVHSLSILVSGKPADLAAFAAQHDRAVFFGIGECG